VEFAIKGPKVEMHSLKTVDCSKLLHCQTVFGPALAFSLAVWLLMLSIQVLEGVIKYRWNALPVEQRDGIKNYISDLIVQLSSNEVSFRTERLYVNKLNIILVQASGSSLQCVVMCKLLIGRIGIISFFGTERNVLWVCQIFVVKFLLYKDTGNVDWIPFRASFLQEIDIGMNPGALLVHVG
jgi:hypothetical protein